MLTRVSTVLNRYTRSAGSQFHTPRSMTAAPVIPGENNAVTGSALRYSGGLDPLLSLKTTAFPALLVYVTTG